MRGAAVASDQKAPSGEAMVGGDAEQQFVFGLLGCVKNDSDGVPEQNPEDAPEKSFAPLR